MRTGLTILATAFTLALCISPSFADNRGPSGTNKGMGTTGRGTITGDPCLNPNRGPNTMDAHGKPCPSMHQGSKRGDMGEDTIGEDQPRGRLGTGGVIDDINSATGGTGGSTTDSTTGVPGGTGSRGTMGGDHGGTGAKGGTR